MFEFRKFTLARQFLLVFFLILQVGMVVIGILIANQIRTGVTLQTAGITALYVDSFISPVLQSLASKEQLSQLQIQELDELMKSSKLGQQIVSFRIWSSNGEIIYSPNREIIGNSYPVEEGLLKALSGAVTSELTNLEKPENWYERQYWDQLIETYAPIREDSSGEVIAVSEFYQLPDNLNNQIRQAQIRSWIAVVVSTITMYLLLAGMFGRASNTILKQKAELTAQIAERELLVSELHDHLAQTLGTLNVQASHLEELVSKEMDTELLTAVRVIKGSVKTAYGQIRAVVSGLATVPPEEEIDFASKLGEIVEEFQAESGLTTDLDICPHSAKRIADPMVRQAVQIAREALINVRRHAQASAVQVEVCQENRSVVMKIRDNGRGFLPEGVEGAHHLGLRIMRSRAERSGGALSISSVMGEGTTIEARFPAREHESQ